MKTLLNQTTLQSAFAYSDGNLYWKLSGIRGFSKTGQIAGTLNKGYVWVITKYLEGVRKCYGLQRLIWIWHNGAIPDGMVIDHVNRNPLDNRIENLRLVTRSQNSMNASGKKSRQISLPKNVYVDFTYKKVVRYRTQVCVKGRIHRLGGFDTPEKAHLAAQQLRETHHGKFSHEGI